mmetsp:Transcript_8628/g.23401  ORF Transcript_8628/g.23401 Transcript_8628/m.23401 type:complete len:203 (+) Transcript_8628:3237-3845(+)
MGVERYHCDRKSAECPPDIGMVSPKLDRVQVTLPGHDIHNGRQQRALYRYASTNGIAGHRHCCQSHARTRQCGQRRARRIDIPQGLFRRCIRHGGNHPVSSDQCDQSVGTRRIPLNHLDRERFRGSDEPTNVRLEEGHRPLKCLNGRGGDINPILNRLHHPGNRILRDITLSEVFIDGNFGIIQRTDSPARIHQRPPRRIPR